MNGLAKCLELTLITLLLIIKEMLSKIVLIKNASHKLPRDTIHSIVKTNEWGPFSISFSVRVTNKIYKSYITRKTNASK